MASEESAVVSEPEQRIRPTLVGIAFGAVLLVALALSPGQHKGGEDASMGVSVAALPQTSAAPGGEQPADEHLVDVVLVRSPTTEFADVSRPSWVRNQQEFEELARYVEGARSGNWVVFQCWEPELDSSGNPAQNRRDLNAARQARSAELAARHAALLVEAHRQFRELFADPCGLPVLDTSEGPLSLFSAWNRDDLERVTARSRGHYDPGSEWVVTRLDPDALRRQDEWMTQGEAVQKELDQRVVTLGAYQLLHAYRRQSGGAGRWPTRDQRWLVEGLARYLSGFEITDDPWPLPVPAANVRHGRIVVPLVAALRPRLATKHTIDELLLPSPACEPLEIEDSARDGDRLEQVSFSYHSWAFVHFCMHYDGGRYRPTFLTYVGEALRGSGDRAALERAIGPPASARRRALEAEYAWYLDRLLARMVGNKVDPRTGTVVGKWLTDTSAPSGVMPPALGTER